MFSLDKDIGLWADLRDKVLKNKVKKKSSVCAFLTDTSFFF